MVSSRRCGAKTRCNKNALKHGRHTREAIEERRQVRAFLQQAFMLIQNIE
jgi:hypothetical protein